MTQKAIVGEKVGMTQVWTADQKVVPVTVLRVEPARIVQVKTGERDGYTALGTAYTANRYVNTYLLYTQSFVDHVLAKGSLARPARADYSHQTVVTKAGVTLP